MYNEKNIKGFATAVEKTYEGAETKEPSLVAITQALKTIHDRNEKCMAEMNSLLNRITYFSPTSNIEKIEAPKAQGFVGEIEPIISDLMSQSDYLAEVNSFLRKLVG